MATPIDPLRRACAALCCLLAALALCRGGEAPTAAEWEPVAQALEGGGRDAVPLLDRITQQYPRWPDGHRALALARLRAGDAGGAWKAARTALALDRQDAAAAVIGMQALGNLAAQGDRQRFEHAFQLADQFGDQADPGGAVAAQAAVLALAAQQEQRLQNYLAAARRRAGQAPMPMLDFIAAKQALLKRDLAAARQALERAVAADPQYRDALYELGRVRTMLALQAGDAAESERLLAQAEEAFLAAQRLDRHDADSRLALGRARLERGKRLLAAGESERAGTALRDAIAALDEGLALAPNHRDGILWKGDALLRLERWQEAAPLLEQALQAGATDRALPFNLALALSRSGQPDAAARVLAQVKAESDQERLTIALTAFNQGNWAAARAMFEQLLQRSQAEDSPLKDRTQWNNVVRYLAHCTRELSAQAEGERAAELLAEAIEMYKQAGDNEDFPARHWYLHLQAGRGPLPAFEAGKQWMKWDGFFTPPAWGLVVGNYGWKVSRGRGFDGVLKHGIGHLLLWSLLAFVPVILFIKSWLLPSGGGSAAPAARTSGKAPARPGSAPTARRPAPPPAPRPASQATTRRQPPPGGKPPGRSAPPPGGPKTPFSG
ncbi:MAG: hypothetical protein RMM29_08140 [Planctomycetota bacterium]|nr:hypothetical protein [Planctomycetota bacterium]MDW8373596.1 hypothetical protein [Planctomycetota bacterium]